jgi:hypothetical protein
MKKLLSAGILVGFIAVLSLCGCKNEYPDSIWDPNYKSNPTPIITLIEPESGSFAGVGVVTVTGQNFSPNVEDNKVYFEGERATTLTASQTQLTVQVPNLLGDSLKVQIYVVGALEFGEYEPGYKLEEASVQFKAIDDFVQFTALACDLQENAYGLSTTREIYKIEHPDSDKVVYATVQTSRKADGMKMGPDGYLYWVRGNTRVYRVPPGGGESVEESYVTVNSRVSDLDFDQNLNIYAAGSTGWIEVVKPDGTTTFTAAQYTDYEINAVRVYENFVYIAAAYDGTETPEVAEGIWRHEILDADGNLGASELYFDWGANTEEFGPKILCIDFAENGDLYVGMDKDQAITIIQAGDKSTKYLYPEILLPPTTYMCWGNGNYLYVNRYADESANRRVFRVALNVAGAPYYGRQ